MYRCPLGDRQGQPAWRNPPAGSTPPPAVDTRSEVLALLGQSSRGAVPFVHWYRQKDKQHWVVVDRPKGQKGMKNDGGNPMVRGMNNPTVYNIIHNIPKESTIFNVELHFETEN